MDQEIRKDNSQNVEKGKRGGLKRAAEGQIRERGTLHSKEETAFIRLEKWTRRKKI